LVRVTYIRSSLLIPFILLLIYIGAFAEKNTFEDLILVLLFGALSWVMQRLNWPRPPLILGLVLGPLAENRLFLSTTNYGFSWLFRPGVMLIMAVTLVGIFYSPIRTRFQKWERTEVQSLNRNALNRRWSPSLLFSWETMFSLFIVLVFICALWQSRRFNFRAGLFPWTIGFSVLALATIQLIMDTLGKVSDSNEEAQILAGPDLPPHAANRRVASMFGWLIGFLVAIWLLGFPMGVSLCVLMQLKVDARERWPFSIILTLFAFAFIYGLFGGILNVPFPTGKIFLWMK